jgi:hypothetical protein
MERQRGAGLWRPRAVDTVEAVPVTNKECVVLAPYTAAALRMEMWRGDGLWRGWRGERWNVGGGGSLWNGCEHLGARGK